MTISRRALGKNRGIAILLALFFMILLSLIGVALIGLVPVELRSATRTKLDVQAHYAVTSGIRHARSWCSAVMTPTSSSGIPDFLGDDASTTGNSFYNTGASYYNDITGVNGDAASVEYRPMTLADVWNNLPRGTARWATVNDMLNIPSSGDTKVDPNTVVLCKKDPLTFGDWTVYTVIIPDADTPGGINTQTGGKITTFFGGAGKAGRRCYQLISIAYYQGFPTLRGKSVVLEDSFARYSLFVDQDPTGGWFLQGLPGQATTNGPVHTNGAFKFAINPGVWTDTSGKVPFNGLLTFGRQATNADDGVIDSLNRDGAVYSEGNDVAGTSTLNRPFDDGGADPTGKYFKMIAGGRSNLRQTAKVNLPPDSTKIANAAYGTDAVLNQFSSGPVSAHLRSNGTAPDGIFVFDKSDGKAAGGVVIKGDQKAMFLEVLDATGHPVGVDDVGPRIKTTNTTVIGGSTVTLTTYSTNSAGSTLSTTVTATNLTGLENGSATGNPAIRVQAKTSQTTTSVTTVTYSSTVTNTETNVSTTGSTTVTSSTPTSVSSTPTSTSTSRSTLYGTTSYPTSTSSRTFYTTTSSSSPTSTRTNTLYGTATSSSPTSTQSVYSTLYGSSTVTSYICSTLTTGYSTSTTGTSYITLGGAGGGRQTVYLTTLIPQTSVSTSTSRSATSSPTSTSTSRNTLYSTWYNSSPTSTKYTTFYTTIRSSSPTSTSLRTIYTTSSSPTSTSSSYRTFYSTATFYSTTSNVLPLTTNITTTSTSLSTWTSEGTVTVTYKPIDQMIEARNQNVTISPSMFATAGLYRRPAGAVGDGSDMDVSHLGDITSFMDANGNAITSPLTVTKGQVVVIKQSRLDPKQAIVFVSDATAADDGSLLNGAVLTEGHIGDPGDPAHGNPGKGGLAGVNMGRKTIGSQIQSATATHNNDPFAPQLDATDTTMGISNNLFQYGTKRYESNTDNLKAENGLGLVGADIRVTAEAKDFSNFLDGHAPVYDGVSDKMLNIHAVILAGSSRDGGLTVNGFTDFNSITPTSMGTTNGQTPMIRFVGGLILRNYYARVNGTLGREAGWNSKNLYNQQLALKPPPYFPNNGLLIPLSYVEERIWGSQKL